jgi:hypothetical protein
MNLRLAGAADAEVLTGFNAAMALETEGKELLPEVIGAGVRALLDQPASGFYLLAENDSQVVGSLLVIAFTRIALPEAVLVSRKPMRKIFPVCCAMATAPPPRANVRARAKIPTNFRFSILDFRLSDRNQGIPIRDILVMS